MERKTFLLLAVGFIIAITLDMLSKRLTESALQIGQPVSILGDFFQLSLGYNTGVAFGMLANVGILTTILPGIVIIGLSIWFFKTLRARELPQASALALGFILGGALGNFLDRLPDGRVTDFLDFGIGAARWPTFNVADSFVFVGLLTFLFLSFFARSSNQAAAQEHTTPLVQ